MIFKLFQLHKSSLISFYSYSIYQASDKRVGLDNNNTTIFNWIIEQTKKNPNPIFNVRGLQKITLETSDSKLWQ